jgi:hypothetical protein
MQSAIVEPVNRSRGSIAERVCSVRVLRVFEPRSPPFPPNVPFPYPMSPPPLPRIKAYRSNVRAGTKSHVAGQGFQQLSFNSEHKLVNKEWVEKGMPSPIQSLCRSNVSKALRSKILTNRVFPEATRALISNKLAARHFNCREDRFEPPHMAPSADPDDYSKVCVKDIRFYCQRSHPEVVFYMPRFPRYIDPLCWVQGSRMLYGSWVLQGLPRMEPNH